MRKKPDLRHRTTKIAIQQFHKLAANPRLRDSAKKEAQS